MDVDEKKLEASPTFENWMTEIGFGVLLLAGLRWMHWILDFPENEGPFLVSLIIIIIVGAALISVQWMLRRVFEDRSGHERPAAYDRFVATRRQRFVSDAGSGLILAILVLYAARISEPVFRFQLSMLDVLIILLLTLLFPYLSNKLSKRSSSIRDDAKVSDASETQEL